VTYWAARNLRLRHGQRFTLSGNLATMGYALPAAIAAKLAYPDCQVIALTGDGGLAMGLGEFLTLVQYKLPVTVVVFNNAKLGLIQMEQEAKGLPEYETGLFNPNFAEFARICGGIGVQVTKRSELAPALAQCMGSGQPAIVEIVVSGEALTVPPKVSIGTAANYARAKLREMFGQGDSGAVSQPLMPQPALPSTTPPSPTDTAEGGDSKRDGDLSNSGDVDIASTENEIPPGGQRDIEL
jgi:pyruvate oxidase